MSDFNINAINSIMSHFDKPKEDIEYDYDHDEDGNMISCCGDVLDPDYMICPSCGEHN